MERLLKTCGTVISWKRSTDANKEPKSFGLAEFEYIESVFAAVKILNNLRVLENNILVKCD